MLHAGREERRAPAALVGRRRRWRRLLVRTWPSHLCYRSPACTQASRVDASGRRDPGEFGAAPLPITREARNRPSRPPPPYPRSRPPQTSRNERKAEPSKSRLCHEEWQQHHSESQALGRQPRATPPRAGTAILNAEALRLLVRRKLHDRRLPHDGIRTVWSTPSDGETCDACDTVLTKDQLLMEAVPLDPGRRPVRMHVRCCQIWDLQRLTI
jgi:hypothetical protein